MIEGSDRTDSGEGHYNSDMCIAKTGHMRCSSSAALRESERASHLRKGFTCVAQANLGLVILLLFPKYYSPTPGSSDLNKWLLLLLLFSYLYIKAKPESLVKCHVKELNDDRVHFMAIAAIP